MKYYKNNFDDNCYYLDILRWFRDVMFSLDDKEEYYEITPNIVESINGMINADEIYQQIYYNVI